MLAGLSFKASDIRIGLAYDGTDSHTGDGTGTFQWDAQLASYSIFNTVSLSDGIQMSIESGNISGPLYIYSFAIPELSISDSVSAASYETSVQSYVILKDVKLLEQAASPWRLIIGDVEWYIDGSLVGSYGGGTLDGTGLGPGYVPLLGIPPRVTSALNPGATGYPLLDVTSWQSSTTATITASYEFKIESTDSWQNLPISIITPTTPSCFSACVLCSSVNGIVSGTNTAGIDLNLSRSTGLETIEAGGKYFTQGNVSSTEGSFWIIPNLDKGVVKLGDSYAALIQRYGLPFTEYLGTRSCGPATPPPGPPVPSPYIETQTVSGEVHPEYTAFLSTVLASGDVIEDPLAEITYLPMIVSNNAETTQWVDIGNSGEPINPALWPDPLDGFFVETVTYSFPSKTQNRTRYTNPNPDMPAYLDWSDTEATPTELNNVVTYVQTIVHPHWSYWYHVQDWDVDGSPTSYDDYWGLLCDQQLYNAALPPEDNLLSRTSLVSAPLRFGGNQSFIETFVAGTKTSWWGTPGTNLRVDRPTVPTSVIATGPDRWILSGCTATFAPTTVTATSTGAATIKLKYDLADWNYSPRMLTSLTKQFILDWSGVNINSVSVNLIGIDNTSYELATIPGTYDFPVGLLNMEYAGSWAQDFGATVITDTGVDTLPDGDSIAANSDNTRVVASQYLSARGAKYLEFVVTVANTASSVILDLPVLVMPTPDWTVKYEGSQFGAALDPDGPAIRFGNVNYWNYLFDILQYPPPVLAPTSKPTVIDWLAFRESVLLGNDPATNIDSLISDYFDSGTEYTLRKHLAYETVSWLMAYGSGLQGVMVNTYCPPPLALFPGKARNSELTEITGWNQKVYSFTQHKRNHITPYNADLQVLLKEPESNWLTADSAPSGWSIASHTHQLDNDETDYLLSLGTRTWGKMRPWHGQFWVQGVTFLASGYLDYTVSANNMHVRVNGSASGMNVSYSDNTLGFNEFISDTPDINLARVSFGTNSILLILYQVSGTTYLGYSTNLGKTINMATTISTSATYGDFCVSGNNIICVYYIDSGVVKGQLFDINYNQISPEFDTNVTCDDAQLTVVEKSFGASSRLIMSVFQSGSLVTLTSTGFKNFS